ncbi:MAG: hypothetical protein LRY37_02875, partial [Alkalibacterium thalassium]|nr:hypothetical protein [Alkalibacterium thalassium]
VAGEASQLKRTPLYDYYTDNGIKLVDFGTWALPIQFTKLIEEHRAVRERVGTVRCITHGRDRGSGRAGDSLAQ